MTSLLRKSKSPLKRLLSTLKGQRQLVFAATTCSILNKLFDLAPPVLIGLSVDVVVREADSWLASFGIKTVPNQLFILAFISFLIWSAESLFEYLYGILWRNLAQATQHNLRIKAYSHLQNLEISFFEADSTGRIMSILNDDINQLERFLDHGANQIIQLIVTVFLVGGGMTIIAPGISILAFLPIPIILLGSIRYQSMLAPKYKEVREKAGDLSSRLNNNLGGMFTIKSFATEKLELKKLREESNLYKYSNKRAIKLSAAFIPLIRFAILFAFLAILIIGGLKAWKGEIAIGSYSFLVFITQRLLWPLTTLGHTLDDYQRSMASTNRVLDLMDTPLTIQGGSESIKTSEINGNIRIENIQFKYKDREPIFNDFNLIIPAGKTLGIVGATGSGKSTLIKLLLRLYQLNKGRIYIDDIPIENLKLEDLRKSISLVNQEFYLFQGSIRENIAYGSENVSLDQIKKASKLSEAYDFIEELPNTFDTIVGERGQKLSGGQRQRIALARAILKNAPILILDEATAAVDNETEAAIQRSLSRITNHRTTIIIAHRLSTVRNADKIIVLERGSIYEQGNHNNLLAKKGMYYDLWKVQAGL
tara:strand:- start:2296 stop:4074 length:1779 start_codon:yes stop_codon:yes gene_type:complete